MPPNDAVLEAPLRHVYKPLPHDSGAKHVQGAAEYIDDIPEPAGTLHVAVGGAPVARGTLRRIDLDEVQRSARCRRGHHRGGYPGQERYLARERRRAGLRARTVSISISQPVFAVVATSRDAARRAVLRGKIEVDAEKPNVTVEQGRASGETVMPDYAFINGDAGKARSRGAAAQHGKASASAARSIFIWKARSRSPCPARTARCWSIRRPSIRARCSTSSPACWRCRTRSSTCRVRRMGGGFGGKETQATQWAVIAALAARVDRPAPASSGSTATPTWR